MIPPSTLVWLVCGALFCFALPIGLLIWWRRTRRAKLTPFFVGALTFFVFALVLEPLSHQFFLLSDNAVSRALNATPYLYGLYGALAAGEDGLMQKCELCLQNAFGAPACVSGCPNGAIVYEETEAAQ